MKDVIEESFKSQKDKDASTDDNSQKQEQDDQQNK